MFIYKNLTSFSLRIETFYRSLPTLYLPNFLNLFYFLPPNSSSAVRPELWSPSLGWSRTTWPETPTPDWCRWNYWWTENLQHTHAHMTSSSVVNTTRDNRCILLSFMSPSFIVHLFCFFCPPFVSYFVLLMIWNKKNQLFSCPFLLSPLFSWSNHHVLCLFFVACPKQSSVFQSESSIAFQVNI